MSMYYTFLRNTNPFKFRIKFRLWAIAWEYLAYKQTFFNVEVCHTCNKKTNGQAWIHNWGQCTKCFDKDYDQYMKEIAGLDTGGNLDTGHNGQGAQ